MGQLIRHVKRNLLYEIVGSAEVQISKGDASFGGAKMRTLHEGMRLVVYKALDGKLWARFPDEMIDGRFEDVS